MDDTFDDRPTAQWTPVDDGDNPTQVVSFGPPQRRPMPPVQAGRPERPTPGDDTPGDDAPTALSPVVDDAPTAVAPAVDDDATTVTPAGHTGPPAPTGPTGHTRPVVLGVGALSSEHAGPVPVPVTPGDEQQGAATPVVAEPVLSPSDDEESSIEVPVPAPTPDDPDATALLRPAMATAAVDEPGAVPSPPVAAGDVFAGRYRLEQQLARRGGTLTWRAFDQKLSRAVLVHVLDHDDPRTADVLEAARSAAVATDSRFLRVLDAVAGEAPGAPSLVVCEFAPGQNLERLLEQGPLSALEAAWVARELADALSSMHAEGLFHQRINPDTVVISATGNVKIVGFLIEQAMHPSPADAELAWSEREAADVRAVGKVLYASLVTRWPTEPDRLVGDDGTPRVTWGMEPAPMDGRGWLTPRQIRSGVSPALDVICDQVLSDDPRYGEPPLRTANQVTLALNKVLGTADAAADLERRLRYPVAPLEDGNPDDTIPGRPLGVRPPVTPPSEQTATMAAIGDDEHDDRERDDDRPEPDEGWRTASTPAQAPAQRRTARAMRRDPAHGARPRPRRWLALLLALVLLAALGGIVRALTRHQDAPVAKAPAAPAAVAVQGVDDFDPTADGGNGEENPGLLPLATDGKASTSWQTVTYLNDPALGRLKPGVGLVLDLGSVQQVGSVHLVMQGQPTSVELRVPATEATDRAPSSSVKQWSVVAQSAAAGADVTLTPAQATRTRYLLVYLTKLPKVDQNRYRGGIAEVQVRS